MNDNFFDDNLEQDESSFDVVALLFRYLNYWYYFVASILLIFTAMYFYLKTITPTYEVNASVIIDDQDDSKSPSAMMNLENLGFFSATNNFDNEIEVLKSRTLIKNTIINSGLYINYFKEGVFRNTSLYKSSPINVWMTPEEAQNLPNGASLSIRLMAEGVVDVVATIFEREGEEVEYTKTIDRLPALLSTPYGTFSFSEGVGIEDWDVEDELIVTVRSPISVARAYSTNFSVVANSKTTTIANLTLKTDVPQRGIDFINTLVELYNKQTNDYKNEVALKTSEFINERILIINEELGSTENELETFKKRAGITDLSSDAKAALTGSTEYQQRSVENSTQLRLVKFLDDYAQNPDNAFEVLPLNVGLSDAGLTQLIASYNEMLLERKRLLVTSSENNPAVVNLDSSIASMRRNVLTSINSVKEGLLITQSDIEREAKIYAGRISNAPTKEREFITISRQQEIQSTLYLMLLQKREENALTLASTANNARIFNEPLGGLTPVAPNKKIFMLMALILGMALPMAVVYLKDLFSFKIDCRGDVESITRVSVLADIPTGVEKSVENSIVVHENQNDIMAESFRALRTNMLFMFQEGQKVAMVTSTSSGEGKSFISSNLAISLALMGKRVIIVGLDIRKPGLNRALNISSKAEGMSNYLANPSKDILSLVQPSEITPNLSVLLGGTIPPNPTELLSRDALDRAIETLKEHYDYVILDTAPIGMITDTQLIARVADVTLYVCRANYTNKSDFRFVNELAVNNRVPKLSVVINDVDLRKRRYGYYGYGNKYGYGYGSQYGYGYGYGSEEQKK